MLLASLRHRGANNRSRWFTTLSGLDLAKKIRKDAFTEISNIKKQYPNFKPTLKIIQVGDRPDSSTYVKMKLKASKESGVDCIIEKYDANISQIELLSKIKSINQDDSIHGLLIQLPLPKHLNEPEVTNAVSADKDVDGFGRYNIGELTKKGGEPKYIPCTPNGCIKLLEESGIDLEGKNAVVLGRSDIVGIPVASLLQKNHATVTICHSRTKNLHDILSRADIVIAAIGKPNFVKGEWLKQGCVVIDVGINYIDDSTKKSGKRLVGDVDFESCKNKTSFITPVPGGVGPMTVAMLVKNVLLGAERQLKQNHSLPEIIPNPLNLKAPVPSDIQVSKDQTPKLINDVAKELKLKDSEIELFGFVVAK